MTMQYGDEREWTNGLGSVKGGTFSALPAT